MSNQTIRDDSIRVHGRGSLDIPYKVEDASGAQIDISQWEVYFEVDGLPNPIRERLSPDPNDPLGLRIVLERSQVEGLSRATRKFAVIDETNLVNELPVVLWSGTIRRDGYVGTPDTIPDPES